MELADIIAKAISSNRALINQVSACWPDRPIEVEMSWYPRMGKLDVIVRGVTHLPPFHPDRGKATE